MHDHERVDAALCDQPGGDHCLAKGRCGGQDAGVVRHHRVCRRLLLGPQLTLKGHLERAASVALVANGHAHAHVAQHLVNLIEASSRQADVMRVILGTRDDARLGVGGQTHRLSLVELRILKRRQSEQPVSETRMQSALGDVDLIAENQIQRLRQSANDRRLCSVPRGRSRPRLFFSIVLWRQTHAEDATTPFGLPDDLFNLRSAYPARAREIRPLVSPGDEVVIEEDAVALSARSLLHWQGDQVPESSLRHRVLIRKETIVRIQPDVRPAFHRFSQDVRAQPARQRGWNGVLKEEPDVRTSSGT